MLFTEKLLDMLKMESTREEERRIADGIPLTAKTIYFKNGKMYKIRPSNADDWYDAKYLVSDGEKYDLEKTSDLSRIPVPKFQKLENDKYGATGLLDYVLRMKSRYFYSRREKELCSACLWKATEMMFANPLCKWSKDDYIRLINYHMWLDMEDEAKRAQKYLESKGMIFTEHELQNKKSTAKKKKAPNRRKKRVPKERISWQEKELIAVQNVTTNDMRGLEKMPFVCNIEVKKYIHEGNHPLAYMEILGENVDIVKSEIKKINSIIKESIHNYPAIPQNLSIPANSLVYQSPNYGYTRIMCTPKTYDGKPSQYPYALYFCTDLSKRGNTTHGELSYGQNGIVEKANVCFWRDGNGFFLNFKMIDGKLTFLDIGQSRPAW